MNNSEFITFIDECIKQEMLLGSARNENKLNGFRNIKSDFTYIASREKKMDAIDIVKKLYKERVENAQTYYTNERYDLWLQEKTEKELLEKYLPTEPLEEDVISFLKTLDIPKQKASFKKFQNACTTKFGQKVDSNIILNFINGN